MSESSWFTFVHCADLHLDSPFEGIHAVDPEIASVLRHATFQAFDNIVDLAIREAAAFIIVAGDVYDAANRSLRAQIRFRDSLRRATEAGIQCFVVHGNHDPLSGWEANLTMPDGVFRFGGNRVEHVAVRHLGETLAHLYGISYPTSEVRENLVPKFPKEIEKPFAIGILHGNVGGDPNHDNYAPCSLHDLLTSRMDYWALGHIHSRKILREHSPSVVYPGTTQGRSGREPGARGCIVVRVARGGHLSLEFNSTDVVRWFTQAVDIRDLRTIDDLLEELAKQKDAIRREAEGRAAIWRLPLTGRGELHGLLRRLDLERDLSQPLREGEPGRSDFVWLESIQDMTRPSVDLVQRRQVQDFIGDVLRAAETLRGEEHPQGVLQHAVDRHIGHRLLAAKLEKLAPSDWLAFLDEAENYAVDLLTGDED